MEFMIFIILLIAIVALILAYKAYTRSGGTIDEMRSSIHDLGISTEKIRQMTADALAKMEKSIRGKDHPPADGGGSEENKQQ